MTTSPTKQAADEIAGRCIAAQARILSRVVTSLYEEHLRHVGLTAPQMTLLVALEHTGGVAPSVLCSVLKLDKSTLSRTADRMERNGWLTRVPDPNDARSHLLRLTEAGRKKFKQAIPAWRKGQAEAEALLGPAGVKALKKTTGM
jgi:DNA-binding MarR family transcriptional regulator